MNTDRDDYDSPWKEILEYYFQDFMTFFFPKASRAIDWGKGYQFLDKELEQVVRDAALGKRYADKLLQLWQIGGESAWVMVHVEIQGERDTDFAKRMYVYNCRIFDRYERAVASLAVLADNQLGWKPDSYTSRLFDGCGSAQDLETVVDKNPLREGVSKGRYFESLPVYRLDDEITGRSGEGVLGRDPTI